MSILFYSILLLVSTFFLFVLHYDGVLSLFCHGFACYFFFPESRILALEFGACGILSMNFGVVLVKICKVYI